MLKILLLILSISSSVTFASSTIEKKPTLKERKTLSKSALKEIVSLLEANEKLHRAFYEYSGPNVEKNSLEMISLIDDISDPEISKLLQFSKKKLGEIKASAEKDENNKTYNLISMALIYVINNYDVGKKYNAYSCPMVKKKWIQNSEKLAEVHNPYAPEMPQCGSKDTNH